MDPVKLYFLLEIINPGQLNCLLQCTIAYKVLKIVNNIINTAREERKRQM